MSAAGTRSWVVALGWVAAAVLLFWIVRSLGLLPSAITLAWMLLAVVTPGLAIVALVRRRFSRSAYGERSFWVHAGARVALLVSTCVALILALPDDELYESERREARWFIYGVSALAAASTLTPRRTRAGTWYFGEGALAALVTAELFVAFDEPVSNIVIGVPFAGPAHVLHGGGSALTNHHALARNQQYALDLRPQERSAVRPSVPAAFGSDACYGEPVLSPVSGRVTAVVDHLPDTLPGREDASNPAGNHVIVKAPDGDWYVLLAHLAPGSVRVREGQVVEHRQVLGACGNSGNSTQPHLHLHVQNRRVFRQDDTQLRGLPFRFEQIRRDRAGRIDSGTLAVRRNDRVRGALRPPAESAR